MIKVIPVKGLPKCPICGSPVQLQRNSGRRFQVKCSNPKCYVHTDWRSKTDALAMWGALTTQYAKNQATEEDAKRINAQ